eukprot:m.243052 g.243052  ORF g.243052 m.243052 type:complete len:257 (+) comp26352_c0_seq4:918-1688(+)
MPLPHTAGPPPPLLGGIVIDHTTQLGGFSEYACSALKSPGLHLSNPISHSRAARGNVQLPTQPFLHLAPSGPGDLHMVPTLGQQRLVPLEHRRVWQGRHAPIRFEEVVGVNNLRQSRVVRIPERHGAGPTRSTPTVSTHTHARTRGLSCRDGTNGKRCIKWKWPTQPRRVSTRRAPASQAHPTRATPPPNRSPGVARGGRTTPGARWSGESSERPGRRGCRSAQTGRGQPGRRGARSRGASPAAEARRVGEVAVAL